MQQQQLVPGLDLFTDVLDAGWQRQLLGEVDRWIAAGRAGKLLKHTYQAPHPGMSLTGQSRETLLYGVYVKHNKVSRNEVEPLPPALEAVLDKLELDGIFTPTQRPNTCCINMYDEGSWIPPHVDSEAFARPFCTVSLRSVQAVLFGEAIEGENGDWSAGVDGVVFAMPLGSVLRVDGASAGPAKHALPRATNPRVSLTFRQLSAETAEAFEAVRLASVEAKAAKGARKLEKKRAKGYKPRAEYERERERLSIADSIDGTCTPLVGSRGGQDEERMEGGVGIGAKEVKGREVPQSIVDLTLAAAAAAAAAVVQAVADSANARLTELIGDEEEDDPASPSSPPPHPTSY
jgi:hypothetical protein